jgi:hypothetical protein
MSPHRRADRLKAIDEELLAVQQEYFRRSVGLFANELAELERRIKRRLRSLRRKRSALVRAGRKT